MSTPTIATAVRRGLKLRCPHCGEGRLFRGFLKVREQCEACGADNTIYPSDDAAPYLTLFVVGHILVPVIFWVERAWAPSMWLQLVGWSLLFTVATVAMLPRMKGLVVGFACATGVTRATALQ